MIINAVHLKNFKSHEDTRIDFGPGINVILGDNGAGKTSILEAVSFALFKDYAGNVEELVRSGHSEMSVEVDFTSHGRKYRVSRRRTKSSADSKLLLLNGSGKELRSGDAGVDEEIESILGIDKYLFSNAVYVRQGEIERLLTETAHRKKQLIGRLIGIEVLEKVWELMRPLTDGYKDRKSLLEGEIMREDDISRQVNEVRGQLSEMRTRLAKMKTIIEKVSSDLKKAEAAEKELAEAEKNYIAISAKRDELAGMIERENERLENAKRQASEMGKTKLELEEIKKKLEPGWRDSLDSRIGQTQKKISELDGKTGALRGRISEINEMDGKLDGAGNRCPLCGSEITEAHRKGMVTERKDKLQKMQKEIQELIGERAKATDAVREMNEKMMMMSGLEKRQAELGAVSERHDDLARTAEESGKLVKKLMSEMQDTGSRLKALEKGRTDHDEARKKVSALRDELGGLRIAQGNLEGKTHELSNSLGRLDSEAHAIKGKKKEHDSLVGLIKVLGEIRSVFDKSGLQLELRKRAVPVIENHIREFFREFNFEYSDISLDENYDITLYGPGGESTTGMISGGEKIAAALALRLGIARSIMGANAETVILDEPTVFLDEQRRQDLIEVLKKMTVIPQMIVVTHDPAMEDAADHITVIKKSKGISSVSGN